MWYVIQVINGREDVMRERIERVVPASAMQELFYPQFQTEIKVRGEWVNTTKPLFPGYLICDTADPRTVQQHLLRTAATANSVTAAAGAAGDYLTNEEAYKMLRGANSGVKPELGHRLYRVVKRTVDIVAAGGALVLLFIPGVILSVVICIKSPGASPLYSQWRVGRVRKDGTFYLFKIYKFRSMVPNADQMLKDLQAQNEATCPMFKMKHDPRIIPGVGNFIRKHSIDELPQLINVFLGQMNLIGPRPGLPREVALYSEHDMKRLAVKPGCSGPWQVMGRSYLGFNEMVELDLDYIENRSLRQDLRLIFGTLKTMFSGEGAV